MNVASRSGEAVPEQERLGLFDTPPGRDDIRGAAALTGLLVIGFLLLLPVGNVRLGEFTAFVPVLDAVMFAGELIIATMLFAQAEVFRSRALAVLASGFVFIAVLLVAHVLTFPGVVAPDGLFGAGVNGPAWAMTFRRLGASAAIVLYVVLRERESRGRPVAERSAPRTLEWVLAALGLAVVAAVAAVNNDGLLPPILANRVEVVPLNLIVVHLVCGAVELVALVVLFLRRRSVLDVWLLVSLVGWLVQTLMTTAIQARFTAGWYGLNVVILLTHLILLLALIAESNRLYARLALSTAARARERDARLLSMDAVAAAISHEVGQPLAAMTLSARASLNSLTRTQPNPDKAIESLRDTIDAGRRTFETIKSVRAMFRSESEPLSEFSLNDLVRETVALLSREFAAHKISLELALAEELPPIRANRVQIQRVLLNLLTNAIQALGPPGSGTRRIAIRSAMPDPDNVLLEIGDSGAGISPEQMARIFDPFYTTKSTGMGLGLSLSRTILEEHHGRLWASNSDEQGAILHLQLPSSNRHATRH